MLKNKSKPENIIVAIGPCISLNNYNVKEDFKKKFIKKSKKNKMFFKIKNQIIYFDLLSYVKFQLKSCKISKIDVIKIDTFNDKNKFFSARRSLKLKHDDWLLNESKIPVVTLDVNNDFVEDELFRNNIIKSISDIIDSQINNLPKSASEQSLEEMLSTMSC